MKVVAETIAALGAPILMRPVGGGPSPMAVIARWRHGSAEVDVTASDTLRIAVSLQDGHQVTRGVGRERSTGRIRAGSVLVAPVGERTQVTIEGESDILQIFIRQSLLDVAGEGRFTCPALFDAHDRELQAASMQLLVASLRGDPDDLLLLETGIHRLAARLLGGADLQPAGLSRGGLAGAVRRSASTS